MDVYFRDPLSLIPERWLGDERYSSDQTSVLQPFSVDTRDCLGRNFAYHEMRMIMVHVMLNFDFEELCSESDNWMDQDSHILWEKHPVKLYPARLHVLLPSGTTASSHVSHISILRESRTPARSSLKSRIQSYPRKLVRYPPTVLQH
jgi:hypothetical protein